MAIETAIGVLVSLVGKPMADAIKKRLTDSALDFFIKKITNNTPAGRYYKNAVQEIYREKDSELVGKDALSNDTLYIDAYSMVHPDEKILRTIEQWSREKSSGVMLIHGEPGHGKTTLCRKAVDGYLSKRFCEGKTNVFWFRLNPHFAEDIIQGGKFVLKNAFCWGDPDVTVEKISLEDNEKEYTNSVVFLDGYDELKAQLHGVNKNLQDFITVAKKIAQKYGMHIVITTRTRSLEDEGKLNIPILQFAPISEKRQDVWIEQNASDYKEDFGALRASSEEMREMLGIPILFRMVVHARLQSTAAKNVVELYDTLFEATMERRAEDSTKTDDWRARYEQLAYEIYCNDETFADMRNEELPEDFLYMFYLKGEGEQHVEFLHRSFYQYFLAYFLYHKMAAVKDEISAEDFLCCLAERRIDADVLEYIRQIQMNQQKITEKICEQIVDVLEQTGTIIVKALEVRNKNGNAEQHPLIRCENLLVNALNICCIVASASEGKFAVSLYKKKNIHQSMRKYDCRFIYLVGVELSGADLEYADLSFADLSGANLSFANLNLAKLGGIDLNYADLGRVNLSGADLRRAGLGNADLRSADLRNVDLRSADLNSADLRGADLRWVKHLERCDLSNVKYWNDCRVLLSDRDSLGLDDPDAHGIIWCDDEGNPIPPSHLSNP